MELCDVIELQSGVVARRQALAAGLQPHDVRRLLRRRQWATVHHGVYVDHTGPLTWLQRAWAAVLALEPAALSHRSAIRVVDGPGRRGPGDPAIHVAVDRCRTVEPPSGVVRHYLGRLDQRVIWNASPPRVAIEHAVLDVASSATSDFAAIAEIANAVQARRTTAARVQEALGHRERIARREFLEGVLADVAAGTCSVLEHGYLQRVERAHGLRAPRDRSEHRVVARSSVTSTTARTASSSSWTGGCSTTPPAHATWTSIATSTPPSLPG
ncbi:type IV toxin-antitoxin system AbiEi family antitoxin domain-containing protein [Nocardioides sp. GXQ0305]|uniref:type IV toxin-antitoxin system AbiEi family antitoxin domain-containing protein n=1 Tax=Nocardioides sp. GXQ0305 TaxID=3423912 RepID=UPI003D7E91AA